MNILGVIPARYASTRFPGKPLAMIGGKSMIERVYTQAKKANLTDVIVATDDQRIFDHVAAFGKVVMTGSHHPSGTDRCQEVVETSNEPIDFVINIQGDEPFIDPAQIMLLANALTPSSQIATLVKRIEIQEHLFNTNVVKVARGKNNQALYFSRSTIPHVRGIEPTDWLNHQAFFKHIGMYAYRKDILKAITALKPGELERSESLEQLRWLEHGYSIQTIETTIETVGIDSPADLEAANRHLKTRE